MNIPEYLYGTNDDLQRYFALLVQTLIGGIGPNGFTLTQLSNTDVASIIDYNFRPIMPAGTQWFNTNLGKMQFISVAANPSTLTNATTETITSV